MNRRFSIEQMDTWLTIIGKAVNGKKLDNIDRINWNEFFNICLNNNVTSFVYSAINNSENRNCVPETVLEQWRLSAQYSMKRQVMAYMQLRKVVSALKNQTIVFFKGIVLANLYPNYLERSSCDSDIWVPEEQYSKTEQVLFDLGYVKDEENSKPEVGVYSQSKSGHTIELHKRLWEDYKGKKIDILSNMELTKKESLIEMDACGLHITTLGYTEHLIYQMFHIIKHFSLQGIGIKYLADISVFINKYEKQIDWLRFWNSMDELGYTKFCNNFFDACTKYFDMHSVSQKKTRGEWELSESEFWNFVDDLFRKGVIDDGSANWQIYGAMTPYFTGEYNAPKEGWKKKLLILFPSRKSLPNNYGYAKKCPLLLPVAWVHRIILFGIHRIQNRGNSYNATQKMNVTQYRLQMMESMGLMEE